MSHLPSPHPFSAEGPQHLSVLDDMGNVCSEPNSGPRERRQSLPTPAGESRSDDDLCLSEQR